MKFIDLFAGIGGFRYGLEKEGFQCVWSNDFNRYAAKIYKRHYGEIDQRDITEVPAEEIPDHGLICAGFPCQSFSVVGRRKGFNDTRGTLFYEICRIAQAKETPYLLLENVKGLLHHDKGQTFSVILESLDELGYDLQWQVLNSKDFGVPQNRERVFIVGHLRGESRPKVFPIEGGNEEHNEGSQGISSALDASYHKGGASRGFGARGRQLIGTGGHGHADKRAMKIRKLTPTECERLQGFPDGWTEGVSDTQRYKCLGNAVTTNVVRVIGGALWPRDTI